MESEEMLFRDVGDILPCQKQIAAFSHRMLFRLVPKAFQPFLLRRFSPFTLFQYLLGRQRSCCQGCRRCVPREDDVEAFHQKGCRCPEHVLVLLPNPTDERPKRPDASVGMYSFLM